jgi:hypothetical protein
MNTFRFRGERILEWRRTQADTARGEFLRAAESVREAARLADAADANAARAARESLDALSTPIDAGTIERHRIWITTVCRHADACRQVFYERQQESAGKVAALQLANRHVKVMERLRERAVRRYRERERQMDMKTLGDLATLQYARRKADEGVEREY